MKYFLEMLEQTKAQGQAKVLNHLAQAQSFVIAPFPKSFTDKYSVEESYQLDLPFRVCAFELIQGNDSEMVTCFSFKNPEDASVVWKIYTVVAEEIEPGKVIFYCYGDLGRGPEIHWFHPDDEGRKNWLVIAMSIQQILHGLKSGQHGTASPRRVFKWKSLTGEKKQVRINQVIYIRPKQSEAQIHPDRAVIWSHAFWVMGHWREHGGLGKDRDGRYVVSGKTWVIPHVKNAEVGDPVNKIRLAKRDIPLES